MKSWGMAFLFAVACGGVAACGSSTDGGAALGTCAADVDCGIAHVCSAGVCVEADASGGLGGIASGGPADGGGTHADAGSTATGSATSGASDGGTATAHADGGASDAGATDAGATGATGPAVTGPTGPDAGNGAGDQTQCGSTVEGHYAGMFEGDLHLLIGTDSHVRGNMEFTISCADLKLRLSGTMMGESHDHPFTAMLVGDYDPGTTVLMAELQMGSVSFGFASVSFEGAVTAHYDGTGFPDGTWTGMSTSPPHATAMGTWTASPSP